MTPRTPTSDEVRLALAELRSWAPEVLAAALPYLGWEAGTGADAVSRKGQLPEHLRGNGPCHDCGTVDNITWFANSDLWNYVMGGPEARDDPGGILCIPCFVKRVDSANLAPLGWRLVPEWHWETREESNARRAGTANAVRKQLTDELPSGYEEMMAWLRRHGLGWDASPGAVLSAVRADVHGSCSVCQNGGWPPLRPWNVACVEKSCPDYGDPNFGEGTCPAEHVGPREVVSVGAPAFALLREVAARRVLRYPSGETRMYHEDGTYKTVNGLAGELETAGLTRIGGYYTGGTHRPTQRPRWVQLTDAGQEALADDRRQHG